MSKWIKDKDGKAVRSEPVTVAQATESALKLIAGAFDMADNRPRFSIPSQPDDDDMVVMDYIRESARENAFLRAALTDAADSHEIVTIKKGESIQHNAHRYQDGEEVIQAGWFGPGEIIGRTSDMPELAEWLRARESK